MCTDFLLLVAPPSPSQKKKRFAKLFFPCWGKKDGVFRFQKKGVGVCPNQQRGLGVCPFRGVGGWSFSRVVFPSRKGGGVVFLPRGVVWCSFTVGVRFRRGVGRGGPLSEKGQVPFQNEGRLGEGLSWKRRGCSF